MKTLFSFFLLILSSSSFFGEENYDFYGRHFIAQYYDCDEAALTDTKTLGQVMMQATKASKATVLEMIEHIFPPHGFSMAILLSESHSSIHTYPEKKACFIDLFTCGSSCSSEEFDKVLRAYLKPKKVTSDCLERE